MQMTKFSFTIICCLLLLSGCLPSRVTPVWTAAPTVPIDYNKIMVAGIFDTKDDSLRAQLERAMAKELSELGYYAVSAFDEFGPYGLRSLSEEATYLSLCDNGIDAVLTFALVDESYGKSLAKGPAQKYTSLFYYNRIWNYRQLQLKENITASQNKNKYQWEVILFDLNTLQPQSVLQSGPVGLSIGKSSIAAITRRVSQQMLRERVIEKKASPFVLPKPF